MHIEGLEVDERGQGTTHENIDVDLKIWIKGMISLQIRSSSVLAH